MRRRRYGRHATRDARVKWRRIAVPVDEREWTPQFAYAVGLIATDGCLVGDGKTVAFVSKDRDLVQTFKACILSPNPPFLRWPSPVRGRSDR